MLLYILPLKQKHQNVLRDIRLRHAETQTGLHTHKQKTVAQHAQSAQPYISTAQYSIDVFLWLAFQLNSASPLSMCVLLQHVCLCVCVGVCVCVCVCV